MSLESYKDTRRIFTTSRWTVNTGWASLTWLYFEKRESKLDHTSCLCVFNYEYIIRTCNTFRPSWKLTCILSSLTTHKSVWHSLRQKWAMAHHYKTISSKSWTLSVLWLFNPSASQIQLWTSICGCVARTFVFFELHNKKVIRAYVVLSTDHFFPSIYWPHLVVVFCIINLLLGNFSRFKVYGVFFFCFCFLFVLNHEFLFPKRNTEPMRRRRNRRCM